MGLELKNVTKKFKTIEGENILFDSEIKLFVLLSFKRNQSRLGKVSIFK